MGRLDWRVENLLNKYLKKENGMKSQGFFVIFQLIHSKKPTKTATEIYLGPKLNGTFNEMFQKLL